MTDYPSLVDVLTERIAVGSRLTDMLVLDKREASATLTLKPLLVAARRSGSLPFSLTDFSENAIVPGFVRKVDTFGVFVTFGNGVTGLCPKQVASFIYLVSNCFYVTICASVALVGRVRQGLQLVCHRWSDRRR